MKVPFSKFVVQERSMVPAYMPGDHVLTFNWVKTRKGDVVVFKERGISMIKRVKKVEKERVFVVGDNRPESSKVGWVQKTEVVGRVIWRV